MKVVVRRRGKIKTEKPKAIIKAKGDISTEHSFEDYIRDADEFEVQNFFIGPGDKARCGPDIARAMAFYIKGFIPIQDACFLIGLFENSHYRWMKQGKDYISSIEEDWDEQQPEKNKRYAYYYIAINKATAGFKKKLIERSLEPDKFMPSWVRDLTILERRDRSSWAKATDANMGIEEHLDPDESFL